MTPLRQRMIEDMEVRNLSLHSLLWKAADNARANQTTREAAQRECLEPIQLEQVVDPRHPAFAESLVRLANGYATLGDPVRAEPLYRRALSIQESAPSPDDSAVAVTLDRYAALLRKMQREDEAVEFEARAQAIRDRMVTDREPSDVAGGGPRPDTLKACSATRRPGRPPF